MFRIVGPNWVGGKEGKLFGPYSIAATTIVLFYFLGVPPPKELNKE